MTGPHSETESPGTRPISVAELLARNGTIGAPAVTRRRRRRRGDSDAVTVAELTGELPVIRDDRMTRPAWPTDGQVAEPALAAPPEAGLRRATPRTASTEERAQDRVLVRTRAALAQVTAAAATRVRAGAQRLPAAAAPRRRPASRPKVRVTIRRRAHEPRPAGSIRRYPGGRDGLRGARSRTRDRGFRVRALLPAASDSTLFGGQTLADELARRRGGEQAARAPTQETRLTDHARRLEADRAPRAHLPTARTADSRRCGAAA